VLKNVSVKNNSPNIPAARKNLTSFWSYAITPNVPQIVVKTGKRIFNTVDTFPTSIIGQKGW